MSWKFFKRIYMNAFPILSLPNEQILPILNSLPLNDLLKCQEVCQQLERTIALLFDYERESIGKKIFFAATPIFSICCSVDDLKIQLVANKFFKCPSFKLFMENWCQKLADDLYPWFTENNDFKNPPVTIQRKELENGRKEWSFNNSVHVFHPAFEPEMFVLFENYDLPGRIVNKIVETYLEEKSTTICSIHAVL